MTSPSTTRVRARIDGLDVARAIAVLGMIAAHIGDEGTRAPDTEGWGWLVISHGFPSSLFAVLAGVSITLMLTQRGVVPVADVGSEQLTRTRIRVAVRGGLLIVMGVALMLLDTFVAIVLTNLGIAFLVALPALAWRRRVLVPLIAVLVLAGGWVARVLSDAVDAEPSRPLPVLDALWSYRYPLLVWLAYLLVGLIVGRLALRRDVTALWLVAGGVALAVGARVVEALLSDGPLESPWLSSTSHSYTPVEMTQNIGVALAVTGSCLWLARRIPRLLWPLRATGSMALTVYVLQILVIALVGNEMILEPSNVSLVVTCAGLVAFACAWRAWLGQGPLERLMTVTSNAAAEAYLTRDRTALT
ncbi:heparan-alpha-glucosaminide N-acetyltransferase domain-containing protein [Demequina activiva]|uniref:heparan-alpha-glucosaminide N-acetyltransferase domain-containing protein n=1 Tax=Demequina activiva TaxID=1582364 RepID=UPI001943B8FF|nr:heparan-alpha-glucosaminide N-acetyltransferase domain-containing protein [Demequina activiva]